MNLKLKFGFHFEASEHNKNRLQYKTVKTEEFYFPLLAKEENHLFKIPDRDEFRNGVVSNLLLRQYNLY